MKQNHSFDFGHMYSYVKLNFKVGFFLAFFLRWLLGACLGGVGDLKILISAPEVPFLVPPNWLKRPILPKANPL